MASRGHILAFHSQNISGNSYATNDHVALDDTLKTLDALRMPILRLTQVIKRLRAKEFWTLPERFVCITFDDGPDYDWKPVTHLVHGLQEPMGAILRRHQRSFLGLSWHKPVATSFVIASPKAREEIAGPANPDRMSDDWWRVAHRSGIMEIGNHGWNHVHPSVAEMQTSPHLIEAFHGISSADDADLQIRRAGAYIRQTAGQDAGKVFAYPYGQVSEFLANQFFPAQQAILGAVTTDGRPVLEDCNVWQVPRYVCGWHWKSNEELGRVLAE